MSIFPTTILVATDGSEEAALALATTADLSKSTNSELHVAYVFPTAVQRPFPNPVLARPAAEMEHELEEAMHQAQDFLDREVVHLSEEIGAGLIVMGSRGLGGVRRALMGSVSDSVVRHAHCPVMIVRE